MRKIIVLVSLLFIAEVYSQQDPHYTQYMYNMSVMNPAYAGSKEGISLGMLYRKQWVELEDAPTTGTLFGHSPVGKNVGLGLSVVTDKIGPVTENNVYGDFSYTLQLGGAHKLALGIKTGVTFHNVDFLTQISPSLPDVTDGVFGQDVANSYFNFGTGIFYYTQKYYLGLSVPNFIKAKHLDFNGVSYGSEVNHYFVTGGYVFDLNEDLKFKPFAMYKSALDVKGSLDVSTNFLYKEKIELGATYRTQDSFGAMVNFMVAPGLRIGYAYDRVTSDLRITTPASHEFILLYDFNLSKKVSKSPRYF
jgi:type IX secretion system PorP/SprF family membrane protein